MATTTRSGAIYGIGTYGAAFYGVSNVAHVPDGVVVTCAVGNVTIVARANTALVSDPIVVTIGSVVIRASSLVSVNGVFTTGIDGNVSIAENARPTFDGVFATCLLGSVSVSVAVFDYDAVAGLYARTRAVCVARKTSSKERTIDVAAQNRVVYMEAPSTTATRTFNVSP